MMRSESETPALDYSPLDALLERLAPFGPELRNGLTNHAPMVLEALCALGRGKAGARWLERYEPELMPWPKAKEEIARHDNRAALGRLDRLADWRALFGTELARSPWSEVVRIWVPRLAPGLSGAATHGLIRAAHAVRSIAERDTSSRRQECAAGLAYWAATFRALPLAGSRRGLDARAALAEVPFVPTRLRRRRGSIDDALEVLADWPDFAPVGALFDADRAPDVAGADLALTFARVLLANATDWLTAIVFVHAITSSVAVASLARLLDATDARDLIRYGWQAGAALYAVYGTRLPDVDAETRSDSTPSQLVDDALASGDEHAIKCTEACLRVWRETNDATLLSAARHATRMLSAGSR